MEEYLLRRIFIEEDKIFSYNLLSRFDFYKRRRQFVPKSLLLGIQI